MTPDQRLNTMAHREALTTVLEQKAAAEVLGEARFHGLIPLRPED
jgi:hypothetical protein